MKKLIPVCLFVFAVAAIHAQPCSELFISEYVEGSSNNKAIEIYNPTSSPVSLTGYKLQLFANGSATVTTTLNLAGVVASGDVYVVVNSLANAAIKATRDTVSGVTNFNGNDAIALVKSTTVLDVVGKIGVDPGTNWPVDTGSTLNHTLVRKSLVHQGDTSWTVGATEWLTYKQDTFFLGSHSMTSCATLVDTIARFSSNSGSVSEGAGSYNLVIALDQAATSTKTIDVELKTGDVADIGNYSTQTVTIPANSTSQVLSIIITDDAQVEGNEQLTFRLINASSGLVIGSDSIFTLTITDNDIPPLPHYDIATITTVNSNGNADSNGVHCIVSGLVYGVNLKATGLQFTIIDPTGGMAVFDPSKNYGYSVHEGDSIVVIGKVSQFAGLTQMQFLDTLYKVGTGTLIQPEVVSNLNESTESELVRINNVHLVDASQWDNSHPSGFVVDITNGSQTFSTRIDEQVDLFSQSAPTSPFDVIGLGSQYDTTAAYTSGYQILPRYSADLILHTGIAENKPVQELKIYPNPGNGVFNIRNDNWTSDKATVKVIDLTGKVVFENEYRVERNGIIRMELAQVPGFYFVQVYSEASMAAGKICIIPPK